MSRLSNFWRGRAPLWTGLFLFSVLLCGGTPAQETPQTQDPTVREYESKYSYSAAKSAQTESGDYEQYTNLEAEPLKLYHEFRMSQEQNKLYDVLILSIMAFLSLIVVLFLLTRKTVYSASHIVNVTGLILIIYGTIVLTLMVNTEQQLTAAIGILGAVAGYLFGTIRRADTRSGDAAGTAGKKND